MSIDTNENIIEIKDGVDFENLDGIEILKSIYNKELNCKKNILECIEKSKELKNENISDEKRQGAYNIIYKSIEEMGSIVKPNTIMFLKNKLKGELGKYVINKDPKETNHFITFFKEAYPVNNRRKDFTWVLMNINKITDEQIWTTLTYINRCILKDRRKLDLEEKRDILKMTELLVSRNNLKYINQVKSLEKLLTVLNIKIVSNKDRFKMKSK